ncbi:MAG: GntR family transcriptional regulator [Oscillospiraceae bacterium]
MGEQKKQENAKYQQLVEDIRKKIAEGYYVQGDKLTSENKLAEEYGYSRQTVRQALGVLDNEGILTRKRGSGTYVSGESIPTKKTYNIGVIATYISDYIFPLIINGIEETLTPMGYHIILGVTKNKIEEESRILKSFIKNGVDGLIVEGTKSAFPNPNLELYRKLSKLHIPVVFFNGYYADLENTVSVVTDDQKAGNDITTYLISRGCKKIAGIFKSDDLQGHRRYSGYSSALLDNDCFFDDDHVLWYTTLDEERFGDASFDQFMLRRFASCDGIVCYNDKIAAALLSLFKKEGIRTPEDIMLGSFDNSKISEYSAVRLTSMNHPKEELGRIAARKLLNLISGNVPQASVRIPMQLVVKDSTK